MVLSFYALRGLLTSECIFFVSNNMSKNNIYCNGASEKHVKEVKNEQTE